jgi:dynein heavy chain
MNTLMRKVLETLSELRLGFAGELTMSDAMEALMESLYMNRVPAPWAKLAWPSERALDGWLRNLSERIKQLNEWTENPSGIPMCTWISGMQNPQSFLTAIMQQTAQANQLELDKLIVITEVTKHEREGISSHSRDGAFIHGLYLEGARWSKDRGELERAKPREMYCPMPVVLVKAVPANTSISGVYDCPVYKTQRRGPTYVFSAQLKTKFPSAKWVMAGVALIMDVDA